MHSSAIVFLTLPLINPTVPLVPEAGLPDVAIYRQTGDLRHRVARDIRDQPVTRQLGDFEHCAWRYIAKLAIFEIFYPKTVKLADFSVWSLVFGQTKKIQKSRIN